MMAGMRFVVYGAGAVGGVVGARLHQAGHEVVLIARGAHRDAIARHGLHVEWGGGEATVDAAVVGHPRELAWRPDDVVVVAVKSQNTPDVLAALAAEAPASVAIVCLQNGVDNERQFLRRFADVYGVPVLAPTAHLEPGRVSIFTADASAIFDIGRWPCGLDDTAEAIAAAFRAAGFESIARPDIARWKYAKLLLNLGNPVDALCPSDDDARDLTARALAEGRAVLDAAGIETATEEEDRARRTALHMAPIRGARRTGGSTWQSLARGQPVEVDALNGEIVLLGRLHGVPTPVNELLQAETHAAVADGRGPDATPAASLLARLTP